MSLILDPVLLPLSVSPLNNPSLTFSISKSDARSSSWVEVEGKRGKREVKDKSVKAVEGELQSDESRSFFAGR